MKRHIRDGNNITHILNVKVSREGLNNIGTQIRQTIFHRINGIPITKEISGVNVTITWNSNATASSAYYYADVGGIFGDVAVKRHTVRLLNDLLTELDERFNRVFSTNVTGLAFLVTKPLVREVVIDDDDDD